MLATTTTARRTYLVQLFFSKTSHAADYFITAKNTKEAAKLAKKKLGNKLVKAYVSEV